MDMAIKHGSFYDNTQGGTVDYTDAFYDGMQARIPGHLSIERAKMYVTGKRQQVAKVMQTVS